MRMRDQLIVIFAVAVATIAVGANVFAQTQAEDRRAENERVAIAAAWAQPIVPTTATTSPKNVDTSDANEVPATSVPVYEEDSNPPGQNKVDCIPPGQVDRDKPVPPGQDRDMCVPPGQDKKDEETSTPPGQDKDKDEETSTPPGQDKDKDEETSTPPGQDKDKDEDEDD